MSAETSAPRCAGWQVNRLPNKNERVLVRSDAADREELFFAYHDGAFWRVSNGRRMTGKILGWITISDAAFYLDAIPQPTDA